MFDWAYLIPLAPFLIGGLAIWTRHQHKMAEMQLSATAESTAEKAAQYASRVGDLEERVRVLERIVTATTWQHRSKPCATSAAWKRPTAEHRSI